VLGLALGVAVFLVLMLVVRFQTSFEAWIPHADQIYLVRRNDPIVGGWRPATMGSLLNELRADYPQIVGTRVGGGLATVRQGAAIRSEQVTWVDPSFFKVFDLPLIAGDRTQALQAPDEMVIAESKARTYFGAANPLGQRLTLSLDKKVRTYRIVGVIRDPPPTTDFNFDVLIGLQEPTPQENPVWRLWSASSVATYLRFATPGEAKALGDGLESFIDRHAAGPFIQTPPHKGLVLRLTPLRKMHLIVLRDAAIVAAIAAVAVLTLLLAAVNYVNLATARASMRAKEVALRKVMGATRPGLIAQFVGESVVVALSGALIGLALCELVLPLFNAAIGVTLTLDYLGDLWVAGMMAFVVLVVGVGAGF
jgi:putative ABC transport system permease protein